jgi:hypothetical protein
MWLKYALLVFEDIFRISDLCIVGFNFTLYNHITACHYLQLFGNLKRTEYQDQMFVVYNKQSMDNEVREDSDPDDNEQSSSRKKSNMNRPAFQESTFKYPGIVQSKKGCGYFTLLYFHVN